MSNATPLRVGQANQSGDVDLLFLKTFAGETLTAFATENKMLPLTTVRTITNGKSAQFPVLGVFNAAYHTPGTELLGAQSNQNEVVITIDDILVAQAFIASIDEAKTHYDVRAPYSKELGEALAKQMDRHLLQVGVLAARASGTVSGRSGGSIIFQNTSGAPASADFAANGSHLAAAIFMAAQELDSKDVPENDRYCIVRPAQYYALVRSTDVINRDWGGQGAYAEGTVLKVAGINIVKSNNLPSTDLSAVTDVRAGTGNRYRGNFVNTVGLVFHKSAIGTVKLMDLSMEQHYDYRRLGTLMYAKYAVGHGILRPEAAVEIRAASSP